MRNRIKSFFSRVVMKKTAPAVVIKNNEKEKEEAELLNCEMGLPCSFGGRQCPGSVGAPVTACMHHDGHVHKAS